MIFSQLVIGKLKSIPTQTTYCVSTKRNRSPYQKKRRKACRHDKTFFFFFFCIKRRPCLLRTAKKSNPNKELAQPTETTPPLFACRLRLGSKTAMMLLRTATGRYVYTQSHVLVPRCQVYRRVFVRI